MAGRVGLQQQARRPPGFLGPEVRQTDAGRGLEPLPVGKRDVDRARSFERDLDARQDEIARDAAITAPPSTVQLV
ncbi:hypothetical protein [Amycolatopsis lexingtonensis]|uniref:hypothetical protein n=1 Tax=Amycolatopsis lexingtonensis TaxID=218822 RepID=UPI001B808151|nr:hypothetical protein [Amycolatopsis lexingtonensis]